MQTNEPTTRLDARFSSDGAQPTPWSDARRQLEAAAVFWLSTVRPDGRPHVTPVLAMWVDDALHFSTGPTEQKARNLEHNQRCALTTGCNALNEGIDLVVEGTAVRLTDQAGLQRVADACESKYGVDWHFDVRDGAFHSGESTALVFAVAPDKALGFSKGAFSQTRWRFRQPTAAV
jgi:hypothetical protein